MKEARRSVCAFCPGRRQSVSAFERMSGADSFMAAYRNNCSLGAVDSCEREFKEI